MHLKIAEVIALRKENWKRLSDTDVTPLLPSLAFFLVTSQMLFQNDLGFSVSFILTGDQLCFISFCIHTIVISFSEFFL